jgi:hypothetical protein
MFTVGVDSRVFNKKKKRGAAALLLLVEVPYYAVGLVGFSSPVFG